MDDMQLLRRLEAVIRETDFAWSLCLVGEDQSKKLASLTNDLKRPPSATGDGKEVVSGYSYWGIEPTIAWQHACSDPYYPVARDGIRLFARRWRTLQPTLGDQGFHYVSLGPGTGEKDSTVLQTLHRRNADMFYVPVDMSAEMLRICVQPMSELPFIDRFRRQVLPVQLDFSDEDNLEELAKLRNRLVGDEPVLFSLLGNTVANFQDDVELIAEISRHLVRPQDRLLLEVATTSAVDADTAALAAAEYERSRTFREFVTSSLHQHTDLPIDRESVAFEGSVQGDRAVLVKVIYRNRSDQEHHVTLPDRDVVAFPPGDTIRLYLSRKYARPALDAALAEAGLTVVGSSGTSVAAAPGSPYRFGLNLVLLAYGGRKPTTPVQELFRSR